MNPDVPKVIRRQKLDLRSLLQLAQKPALFARHESRFWDDPHIAQKMLAAHLDPHSDLASRRHETIDRSVGWLVSHLQLKVGQKVLDLGCGPGLYCTRLHRLGLNVTGMDFSLNSLTYAREFARENNMAIDYIWCNYLTMEYVAEFDAIFLIYYDFGVLSDKDRHELLTRIQRALKPGGAFVFDVYARNKWPVRDITERTWAVSSSGFWKPSPYIELTKFFHYREADSEVQQTLVIEEDGSVSVYRIWNHYYSIEAITSVLDARGFLVQDFWSDLVGKPYAADSESLGVVARKR